MEKKKWAVIVCLSLGFCLTACKGKAQKAKVETIDGVTYVHNLATPLHPNRALVLEEDLVYQEKDETGETRLFKPGSFTVDAQGNVYISDDSDTAIKVFDTQGIFLRSIGGQGAGPGEFQAIYQMVHLPDGRLLVLDFQARRPSFFSPDGQFLTSFQWKKNYSRVYLATNSTCTVDESVFTESKNERWVKTIDFSGEEKLSFGKFTSFEFKMMQIADGVIARSVPWTPASVFSGDEKRQWLYHCPTDKYLIDVYDQQAKLFRKIDRPYEPVPVTSEDINRFKSRYADKPESPAAKLLQQMEFPKVKPVTDRLLVDTDGNLWVQTNEKKREAEKDFTAFDIFNLDGFYDARVWTDVIPLAFSGGKMYLTDEDEATGLRQVKRYRISWKES